MILFRAEVIILAVLASVATAVVAHAQLVRHCLSLAAEVASQTGRDAEELCEHIRAQERYAEQAYEG